MKKYLAQLKIGENQQMVEDFDYYLPQLATIPNPLGEHARNNLDRQLRHMPQSVRYCTKCVLSNQRPRTEFDSRGVCSACNYREYKETQIDWNKRKKDFASLLDKYRRSDGSWDVLVPCSGGKDSGTVAHRLKHVYGMNPLCVTWSPLLYTPLGFQNFQNMTLSGLDSLLCSPERLLQRKIAKLCFVILGDHFDAFSRGQMGYPFYVALQQNIKLIMLGENAELEYGGDSKKWDIPYNPFVDWLNTSYKGAAFQDVLDFGHTHGYLSDLDMKNPSLRWYSLPKVEEFVKAGITVQWFSWYNNWNPQENYYYVADNYNFRSLHRRSEGTYSKYASIDDLTDPFHFYLGLIKFGIGRATSDAAHEIRDGHLTREEGVALVRRYDDEFPQKHFATFLKYLDITDAEFWEVVDAYRSKSSHLWHRVAGQWQLIYQVS